MTIDWPSSLISDIARRRCVVVLGSGISANAQNNVGQRPKTWQAFLEDGIDHLQCSKTQAKEIKKLLRNRDFLTACQVLRDLMGDHDFHLLAESEYLSPKFDAAEIHDKIIELDSRIVATPNIDTLYENRINHLQSGSVPVKHYYDNDVAQAIRGTNRIVLKIHGSIHSPNRMIFTRRDYAEARSKHSSFYEILQSLVVTQTFVFLGCGLDDPDIRLILEDYGFRHEIAKPHFFVVPSTLLHRDVQSAVEGSLNVRFLKYPCPTGNHEKLLFGIKELVELVGEERRMLAKSLDW